jgi:Mlc titration factor MtfA (ptsG expression regulator)
VYPSGYTASEDRYIGGGIWEEGGEDRLGHTGSRLGVLVLAWDAVHRGAAAPDDGKNLVLHEFAHQLDFEDHSADGTPALDTRGDYLAWARVMSAEFNALRAASHTGEPTLLDQYGAKNPPEFFAVVTEAFFEQPRALKRKHPALFAQLQRFYRQDPTTYSAEPAMAD